MKTPVKHLLLLLLSLFILCISACGRYAGNFGMGAAPTLLPEQPQQIALLLPLSGAYGVAGKAVRDGFFAAYYKDPLAAQSNLNIRVYDTSTTNNVYGLYRQALSNGAQLVIGPLQKEAVYQVAHASLPVPVLALNYLAGDKTGSNNFYQFGLSPVNEAVLVAQRAFSEGKRHALMIYPNNEWGQAVAEGFAGQWQNLGGQIVDHLAYNTNETLSDSIRQLLQVHDEAFRKNKASRKAPVNPDTLRRQDIDSIFFVAQTAAKAREIVPLLNYYYAGNLSTYSISTIYSGVPQTGAYSDLEGVTFSDMPWVLDNNPEFVALKQSMAGSLSNNGNQIRLYALGWDAYNLARKFNTLLTARGTTINGVTGELSLRGQRIFRTLPFARFIQGQAIVI